MSINVYEIKDFCFEYPVSKSLICLKGKITVRENDGVLLTGNSGSGKTTLLYALKGLLNSSIYGRVSGTLLYRNRLFSELTDLEKSKIGFLFQNPDAQMVTPSVRQELAFGLENLGLSKKVMNDRLAYYIREFGIEDLVERKVGTLSGGEKQKIALISIVAMEPQVILFDEPTAFLDPDSAEHFIGVFHRLSKNCTFVIVEHNQAYLNGYINRHFDINANSTVQEQAVQTFRPPEYPRINPVPRKHNDLWIIESLVFSYQPNIPVLKQLNLTIKENEIIGLVGANGSGKTTLLKILAKLLSYQSGQVYYKGKKLKTIPHKAYFQEIGLLFQNPENHFLFNRVLDEVMGQADLLSTFMLEGLEQRNPFTLSEGEKRRLSLALLQALNRQVYLMDEPTFGQDSENKLRLLNVINSLKDSGKSLVIASHDILFLKNITDRIIRIQDGRCIPFEE